TKAPEWRRFREGRTDELHRPTAAQADRAHLFPHSLNPLLPLWGHRDPRTIVIGGLRATKRSPLGFSCDAAPPSRQCTTPTRISVPDLVPPLGSLPRLPRP